MLDFKILGKENNMDKEEIRMGMVARDKVTGFTGIVAGISIYLYGCAQLLLTPKCKEDGSYNEGRWFDEARIEYVKEGIVPEDVQGEKPGGDLEAPTK